MRRITVFLTLMLMSSPSQADPIVPGELFVPDSVLVFVGAPLFANGNNSFCWQCSDSVSGNNLLLSLGRSPTILGLYPGFNHGIFGDIAVRGPAPDFAGLNVSFSFRATSIITAQAPPGEALPRPSVAEGVIEGAVIGVRGRQLELHYSGRVDGVDFREAFIDPIDVPIGGRSKTLTWEVIVDDRVPYTPGDAPPPPVVPEPMSLLLLGSGLAAAAVRLKRRSASHEG